VLTKISKRTLPESAVCALPVIVIAISTVLVAQFAQTVPVNLDFEQGEIGQVPTGWRGNGEVTDSCSKAGQRCAKVRGTKDPPFGQGTLYQLVNATPYLNKKIRFRAAIKTSGGCEGKLHLEVTGITGHGAETPIAASDWQYAELSLDVRPLNPTIRFEFSVPPGCDAWIDDASLRVIEELPKPPTKLVMLGTGDPRIDPERSGPAVAVIANGLAYLIDAGPGVVRRAQQAFDKTKIDGLRPGFLNRLFVTHLHSDHTLGYPDLIFTPAVSARSGVPLEVYGPPGLQEMTSHLLAAWSKDMDVRINGPEHGNPNAYQVIVHEISPGVVFKDDNVTVEAIPVKHTTWDYAFAYKFVAADRTIVVSGDTTPSAAIAQACGGCDILVHEVYCDSTRGPRVPYLKEAHTSTVELARIATEAKPKLLVLYHQALQTCPSEAALVQEVQKGYSGQVISSKDLDVF
jgi:ribonuclease BN (tRNA processing enzyme)